MYAMRRYTTLGFREIGEIFCVDHTTVMHGIKSFESDLESNLDLKEVYSKFREGL